jgi:RNA polymerase sigma-70 factor, ECF subfamily
MRRYGEEIKRVVYMFVKNWQQSEAITQDIFVTMFAEIDTCRIDDTSLGRWVYSIAIRKTKIFKDSWKYRKQFIKGKSKSSLRVNEAIFEERLLYDAILALPVKTLRLNQGKKLMQKSLETLGGEFSWEII